MTPEDRNWVGAWWIGYLVGAVIMLLPAAPMLGFPKLFPNAEKVKQAKSELEDTIEEDKNLNHNFKSVWPATKALVKNIPFLCICLASSTESLAIGGFSTFFSKFVETQFHVTSGSSSLYSGVIIIPGKKLFRIFSLLKLAKFRPCAGSFNFSSFEIFLISMIS